MDTNRYAYNGRLWTRCLTTSDNDSFFHSVFGVRTEEGGAFFDKQTEYRRLRWVTFLTFFKKEAIPSHLADILRECLPANDKYKEESIDDKQNLTKYISNIMTGEQAVTMEEIPILATLENIKVAVFSDGRPVTVIEPNPNISGNNAKEVPKGKPREVVLCLEGNMFVRLEPISAECSPEPDQNNVEKKINPNKYRKGGSAGSKGVEYQVRLTVLVILNALKNAVNGWKLSTENEQAGKFDDIVLEGSEGDILIQSKHKEDAKKRITLEELTSTNSSKDDFSLPKYFLSYLQIKETFNIKNVILCSNAGVNKKALTFLNRHERNSESLLHHDGIYLFCTLNDTFLQDLLNNTILYYRQNFKNKYIKESDITYENLKNFSKQLQLYFNYPSLKSIDNIIEKLLSLRKCYSNSQGKITPSEIFSKIMDWFQQKEGTYFTEIHAKAMFAEIWTDKYCQRLEEYKMSFQKININFLGPKQIFHVTISRGPLLQVIKIYYAVRNDKSKILFVNSDHDIDTQKLTVQAFVRVPLYIYLIVICTRTTEKSVIEEIYGELRHIDECKYKKIILVAKDNKLAQQIELHDIVQVDGSVAFDDLSLACQQLLLKKKIINFQGNITTLEQLLPAETTNDYGKAVTSEILEKLVNGKEIKVGISVSNLGEETSQYYINRTLIRTLDLKYDEIFNIDRLQIDYTEETSTEESIYDVKEKIVLIADTAGMGKTTILAKLALTIKKNNPYLWVIRVILNDFTRILKEHLRQGKAAINLEELLNSQNTTKLTNHLEKYIFASTQKVVLMLDGIDEISPDYTGLILHMLRQCKNEFRFAKIFITTRPHMIKDLKAVLEVEPFILQPFNEQDQLYFLINYWVHNLKLKDEKSKEKCKRYAEAMINNGIWRNLQNDKHNFASLPLHLRISAEIFQENSKLIESAEWTGCKEYVMGDEEEPKVTERINATRLYDLFIEKKRDIFLEKGNPSGNPTAKQALTKQFEECLVYHQSLALEVIFGEDKCHYFSSRRRSDKTMETMMLTIGVVQKLNNKFHFAHRSFADYFVAECLLTELQQNQTLEFQMFVIDTIFLYPQYSTIRNFLDNFLLKIIDTLPYTLFENYQSNIQQSNWEFYNLQSTLIHLLAGEGCITILQFLLKCIKFETITDKEINIRDCYKTDFDKHVRENIFGNTLNILQYLTKQAGLNIRDEQDQTPLHLAAKNDHLEMMKYLIEQGLNVDSTTNSGDSVLSYSARFGSSSTAQYLLNLGADTSLRNKSERTVLHLTAKYGRLDTMDLFVKHGLDCDTTDKYGFSPLHSATGNGQLHTVKYLLEHGVDRNIKGSDGYMAQHLAVLDGRLDTVKFLVQNGFDFNVTNKHGFTPLHLAIARGGIEIAKFLIHRVDCTIENNEGFTALHIAAKHGQLDVVQILVENGSDFNVTNKSGSSPLYLASEEGHFETVKFLMEHGADCNIRDNNGLTALHAAANCGHLDTVRFLVESGVDFSTIDNVGISPLYSASEQGHLGTVKFILEHGADCNIRDNTGFTALHAAAKCGHLDTVRFLVESGADFNATNNCDVSPLYLASDQGHLETVKFLLEHGADCSIKNINGCTALHAAAQCGHLDTVRFLVESGADFNATSIYGDSPLYLASDQGHLETVKFLLEHGAGCNIKDKYGHTALHAAAESGHLDTVRFLVESGVDFNATSNYGVSPLYLASEGGHLETVKFLLEYDADCSIKNNTGFTALHAAAQCGHLDTVRFLVENGVDFNATNNYDVSPLYLASEEGHFETVKFLMEHGADCNIRDDTGFTALHVAAKCGHLDTVRFLVESGVDFSTIDNDGISPLYSASEQGHFETVKFLLEHGADCNIRDNEGFTALHEAAESGHLDTVRFLVESGVDLNATSNYGSSPLLLASIRGHLETVKFLLEHGADCSIKDKGDFTALHLAALNGQSRTVELLMNYNFDLDATNRSGFTPLQLATDNGHMETVKYLLGIDIDHSTNSSI